MGRGNLIVIKLDAKYYVSLCTSIIVNNQFTGLVGEKGLYTVYRLPASDRPALAKHALALCEDSRLASGRPNVMRHIL